MRLSKYAGIASGHPFRGSIPEKTGSGIRVVQLKDASAQGGIDWSTTFETESESKREPEWLQAGDILFAARGSRNYAVIVGEHAGKALAAPHFFVIKIKSDQILPEFMMWQLNQTPCRNYFQKESEGSLTKSIRRSVLENTPVTVPSLSKQKQIMQIVKVLEQERCLCQQLIRNGADLMTGIATRLAHN
jgi:restriction endonuclease S subunit